MWAFCPPPPQSRGGGQSNSFLDAGRGVIAGSSQGVGGRRRDPAVGMGGGAQHEPPMRSGTVVLVAGVPATGIRGGGGSFSAWAPLPRNPNGRASPRSLPGEVRKQIFYILDWILNFCIFFHPCSQCNPFWVSGPRRLLPAASMANPQRTPQRFPKVLTARFHVMIVRASGIPTTKLRGNSRRLAASHFKCQDRYLGLRVAGPSSSSFGSLGRRLGTRRRQRDPGFGFRNGLEIGRRRKCGGKCVSRWREFSRRFTVCGSEFPGGVHKGRSERESKKWMLLARSRNFFQSTINLRREPFFCVTVF